MIFNSALADFVVRLKIAIIKNQRMVEIDFTRLNFKILDILKNQGCIETFYLHSKKREERCILKKIKITVVLKYVDNLALIKDIKLISSPGWRKFCKLSKLNLYLNKELFQGFYIISTSNGLCTSNDILNYSFSNRLYFFNEKVEYRSGEILLKVIL